jgi:hypothetical protein
VVNVEKTHGTPAEPVFLHGPRWVLNGHIPARKRRETRPRRLVPGMEQSSFHKKIVPLVKPDVKKKILIIACFYEL